MTKHHTGLMTLNSHYTLDLNMMKTAITIYDRKKAKQKSYEHNINFTTKTETIRQLRSNVPIIS